MIRCDWWIHSYVCDSGLLLIFHYYYTFVVNIEHWKLVAVNPVTSDVCSKLFLLSTLISLLLFSFSLCPLHNSNFVVIFNCVWWVATFFLSIVKFSFRPVGRSEEESKTIKQPRINCTFHFSRAILGSLCSFFFLSYLHHRRARTLFDGFLRDLVSVFTCCVLMLSARCIFPIVSRSCCVVNRTHTSLKSLTDVTTMTGLKLIQLHQSDMRAVHAQRVKLLRGTQHAQKQLTQSCISYFIISRLRFIICDFWPANMVNSCESTSLIGICVIQLWQTDRLLSTVCLAADDSKKISKRDSIALWNVSRIVWSTGNLNVLHKQTRRP